MREAMIEQLQNIHITVLHVAATKERPDDDDNHTVTVLLILQQTEDKAGMLCVSHVILFIAGCFISSTGLLWGFA